MPVSTLALPDPLQAPKARFRQCLLLALLAHVLLVLMLGSAPPGSAPPGEGAWGRLVIRLQGPAQSGVDSDQPQPDTGPKGEAPTQRFGGSVRSTEQAGRHEDQAGAAAVGAWRPVEVPKPSPNETPAGTGVNTPATPSTDTPVDTATLPAAPIVPSSLPTPTVQAPTAIAPTQAPLTAVTAPTATLGAPQTAPRIALPSPLAPSISSSTTATLQAVPRPTSTLQNQTPVLVRPAPSEALQKLAVPAEPGAALTSVHAPTSQLAVPATPQRNALPAPSAVQRSELAPAATALQAVEAPTARLQSATTPTPAESLPPPTDLRAMTPAPNAPTERLQAVTPPAGLAGSAGVGGPDRGAQLGHDVATAPSAKDSPQPLNLKIPMQGPRISSAGGSSGVLPEVPRPPEHDDKLKKDMDKAKRDDCRGAYAGAGLLAVIPLAVDTVRDKGCKW